MKALQLTRYGGSEAMHVGQADTPTIKSDEVLVEVHAASVNPVDTALREGYMKEMMPLQFPAILGADFAGVVREVGTEVTELSVGDKVFGLANLMRQGSFAELLPVPAALISPMPSLMEFQEAAAVPLAGMNAWQALTKQAHLSAGQRILIHGGAGGIGSFAIQIAKHLGATVITTVRKEHEQYARELGADVVIDYEHKDFTTKVKDLDVVFDLVGGEAYKKSFALVKPGGIVVSMKERPDEKLAAHHGVTALMQNTQREKTDLDALRQLIEAGHLKAHVDQIFPFDESASALPYQSTGHARGKVVIKVRD